MKLAPSDTGNKVDDQMPDLPTLLAATSPFWWEALKWGTKTLVDAGEEMLGEEVKKQTRKILRPVLHRLGKPEADKAFSEAFKKASKAYLARYGAGERELPNAVADLLSQAVERQLDEASRDVLQSYLLTNDPQRAPLDRWVQRQLGGESIVTGEGRVFTQEEVTAELDVFLRELRTAFLAHDFFRADISEVSSIRLLTEIRDALIEKNADLQKMQEEYLAYVARQNEWIVLRGIAPRVQGREVKMRMKDLFVPLQASVERDVRGELVTDGLSRVQEALDFVASPEGALAVVQQELGQDVRYVPSEPDTGDSHPLVTVLRGRGVPQIVVHGPDSGRLLSMADVLAEERVVILGDPGAGKSTLLRYAARAVALNDASLVGETPLHRLPILVRIASFARAQEREADLSLVEYVRERLEKDFAPLFAAYMDSGSCLIMLDGVDEVADPHQRGQVVSEIENLIARYPINRYVVTSRIVGYDQARLDSQFRHFTLAELPPETIRDFVTRWYQAIERESGTDLSPGEAGDRAQELTEAIEGHPGIQRLSTNPLLLTIIALVNWRGSKLPNRRVELYQIACETLIENWPLHRCGVKLDAEQVMAILAPVAYHVFATQKGQFIRRKELMPRLAGGILEEQGGTHNEAAKAARAMLEMVSARSGIFLQRGYDESGSPVYGFLHLTFLEYLTACYLADRWADGDLPLADLCHVPRWREVILLMVGKIGLAGRPDATRILQQILDLHSPYEHAIYRDLLLAAACLRDDLRVKHELSRRIVGRLVELSMDSPIRDLRDDAMKLLATMRDTIHQRQVASALRLGLTEQNPERQSQALELVRHLGLRELDLIQDVRDRLTEGDGVIRASAAETLGQLCPQDCESSAALRACLSDPDSRVALAASKALARMAACSTQPSIDTIELMTDHNPLVRAAALGVVDARAMENPDIFAQLTQLLSDSRADVRAACASALAETPVSDKRTIGLLHHLVADESWLVRYWAIRAVSSAGAFDTGTVDFLCTQLGDEDWRMRHTAAYALLKVSHWDAATTSALRARLEDTHPQVRTLAVRALAREESWDQTTVSRLSARLTVENLDIRANAAAVLGTMGPSAAPATSALRRCLADKDWRLRATAAIALARVAPSQPETVSVLCEHVGEGYWGTCAAYALAFLGPRLPSVWEPQPRLAGPYWRLRTDIVHILLMIDWSFDVEQIERMLDQFCDYSLRTDQKIGRLLLRLVPPPQDLAALWRDGLTDDCWETRDRAAHAIGELRVSDCETICALTACLKDQSADVRASAAYSLGLARLANTDQVVEALSHHLTDAQLAFYGGHVCDNAYSSIISLLGSSVSDTSLLP